MTTVTAVALRSALFRPDDGEAAVPVSEGQDMSNIDDLLRSGGAGAEVSAILVSSQENGLACYAAGRLIYTPALMRVVGAKSAGGASSSAHLETSPGGVERPGPFTCYFSDRIYFDPRRPPQLFDTRETGALTVSLSGFDGTALATTMRLALAGRKPVVLSLEARGDLFTGIGRSFADGSRTGYVLAVNGIAY